jgi:hypothetical protein
VADARDSLAKFGVFAESDVLAIRNPAGVLVGDGREGEHLQDGPPFYHRNAHFGRVFQRSGQKPGSEGEVWDDLK